MSQTHTETVPEWTLGWRMQRALTHAGMHMDEMADELEVSRSTVSRWLNDKGPVRRIYLKQFALRCGVPFEWLTGGQVSAITPEYPMVTREYLDEIGTFQAA